MYHIYIFQNQSTNEGSFPDAWWRKKLDSWRNPFIVHFTWLLFYVTFLCWPNVRICMCFIIFYKLVLWFISIWLIWYGLGLRLWVLNTTFNNISFISCRQFIMVEETRVNLRHILSHWQTLKIKILIHCTIYFFSEPIHQWRELSRWLMEKKAW